MPCLISFAWAQSTCQERVDSGKTQNENLGHEETYFVKEHSDSKSKYSEDDIIKMLEF